MSVTIGQDTRGSSLRKGRWSVAIVAASALLMVVILLSPCTVPIGRMYWDLVVYLDAANRIFNAQIPVVDFFTPVGPLGYYLFAAGLKLFPNAQPLLLVSWSVFVVTGPLMAIVSREIEVRQRRGMAFAVLLPFLAFTFLPFNTESSFLYPGSDGYGIYNRQVTQLLYVLAAALIFIRHQRLLASVVVLAMTALFFIKITGFIAGLLICAFAFFAGRLTFRHAVAAALIFFAILGVFQLWNGLTVRYMADIWTLAIMNSGKLLPRFLRAGAEYFSVMAPAGLLVLVLFWTTRDRIASSWRSLRQERSWQRLTAFLDHEGMWLGVLLFAGLFFETQNSGSQALIFLWPVAIWIVSSRLQAATETPKAFGAIAILAGIAVFLPLTDVLHRAAAAYISAVRNEPLPNENLKTIGSVNARPEMIKLAGDLLRNYTVHRDAYRDFVRAGELPTYGYYSDFGFQLTHLMAFDRAVAAIRALEAESGKRFETLMNLNFVNPFPYLLDRTAPKYIAIGADPTRAVPDPDMEVLEAVRQTDLVLYPTCPLTPDNSALHAIYSPALAGHRKIELDDCYDAFVHPRFEMDLGT
ncbi:hypothetical protein [Chelativorans sp. YIM 93263]|uniref:hypothetical protein n=1 Tax=Chelativorans sp. YIM 93263 TaxID=2906648 RepID=UPI002379C4D7|nr:hypothetical protein [Chelativorans sp. YIM 93263]